MANPPDTVATIAALQALTALPPSGTLVVQNYTAPGDQGGGIFVYNPSDTTSPDNGGTILVDAALHRWYRVGVQSANIQWFGAAGAGPGANVAANAAALTNALATGMTVFIPWTALGYDFGATPFNIANGQFVSQGGNRVLCYSQSTSYFLGLTGQTLESGIEDLIIDMSGAPAGSSAVRYLTAVNTVGLTRIRNCVFRNCFNAIGQQSGNYIFDCIFSDLEVIRSKGQSVKIVESQGFQKWEDINIDDTQAFTGAYLANWIAFEYDNFAGLELYHVDHTGQASVLGSGATFNASVGSYKLNGGTPPLNAFVWADRLRSEDSCGFAIQFTALNFIHGSQVECFACLGLGILCTNSNFITCQDWYCRGSSGNPGSAAGGHGITFTGCTVVVGVNMAADFCNGNGLLLTNTSSSIFTNVRGANNIQYDIGETGSSNNNNYINTSLSGTGLGPAQLVGAASRLISSPVGAAYSYTWASTQIFAVAVQLPTYTVATLPAAAVKGQKAFVSNSSVSAAGNFGQTVAAGTPSHFVPVYSDGSQWLIG